LNDYSIGAMEALSWARSILHQCRCEADYKKAKVEVDNMMMRLMLGAAVSFQEKTQMIKELQ